MHSEAVNWRLSNSDLENLNKFGFQKAGKLINPLGLNNFALSIRSSLIIFGKGTTFLDLTDRLSHTLSGLEGVFLRHSMEPTEVRIAERMGFLLSKNEAARTQIGQNVRQAYRLTKRFRTLKPTPQEEAIFAEFVFNAHHALRTALLNVDSFQTKEAFIAAVDRSK